MQWLIELKQEGFEKIFDSFQRLEDSAGSQKQRTNGQFNGTVSDAAG